MFAGIVLLDMILCLHCTHSGICNDNRRVVFRQIDDGELVRAYLPRIL